MTTQTFTTDNYTLARSGDVVVVFSSEVDDTVGPSDLMRGIIDLYGSSTTLSASDHRCVRDELRDHFVDTDDVTLVGAVLGVLGTGKVSVTAASVRQMLTVVIDSMTYTVRITASDEYEEMLVTGNGEHVASAFADSSASVAQIAVSDAFPFGLLDALAESDSVVPRLSNFVHDVMRRVESQ